MDDIEMILVRMNRTIENHEEICDNRQQKIKNVVIMDVDTDPTFQYSGDEGDIMDSGAIDHSSDSDYEPPVSSIVVKTTEKIGGGRS